jgi:hypothetical protein
MEPRTPVDKRLRGVQGMHADGKRKSEHPDGVKSVQIVPAGH